MICNLCIDLNSYLFILTYLSINFILQIHIAKNHEENILCFLGIPNKENKTKGTLVQIAIKDFEASQLISKLASRDYPCALGANPCVLGAISWALEAISWLLLATPLILEAIPWVLVALPWVLGLSPWL